MPISIHHRSSTILFFMEICWDARNSQAVLKQTFSLDVSLWHIDEWTNHQIFIHSALLLELTNEIKVYVFCLSTIAESNWKHNSMLTRANINDSSVSFVINMKLFKDFLSYLSLIVEHYSCDWNQGVDLSHYRSETRGRRSNTPTFSVNNDGWQARKSGLKC